MLESGWLFTGLLALLTTIAAVTTTDDAIAIMAGVLGFISWGVWTFGALNIEVTEGSTPIVVSNPELAILGIAFSLVPAYIALTGPVDVVRRARDPSTEDL